MTAVPSTEEAARLRRSRDAWVGFTACASVLVCGAVVLMYVLQVASFNRAADLARALRQAHADLHQGFMHAMLGASPDSPWDRTRGPALMQQGIRELRSVLPSVPDDTASKAMEQELGKFEDLLARGNFGNRDLAELRVSFYQLDRLASMVDTHAEHELHQLQVRQAVTFWVVLAGSACLLVIVSIGTARAALRERAAMSGRQEADMRFALLAENIDDVFWLRDPSTQQVVYVNTAYAAVWGRSPQQLLQDPQSWIEALHPHDRARMTERISARPDNGFDEEYRVVRPDGGVRWIHDRAFAVRDASGEVYRVVGIAEDITVRKSEQQELRETVVLLQATLQSTDNGVMAADAQGKVLWWNERLVELLGGAEVLRARSEIDVLHAVGVDMGRAMGGAVLPIVPTTAGRLLEVHGQPMMLDGSPGGRVWTFRDVTAREHALMEAQSRERELEERIDARTRELVETVRELEAFTGAVSHDLRAPLDAIRAFADVVLRKHGEALDPQARHYVGRVLAASENMQEMIGGLLELARHSRAAVDRRDLDISHMAREVHALLADSHVGHAVDFIVQDGLRATGDRALVGTLLQNLIGNGLKYSRHREHARVEVGAENVQGVLHFYVRDNGAGFDPAYADRLFKPFSRLHSSKEFEGHGIGLATTSRIVMRHGGRIRAEGAVDQGATFWFTLG